MGVFSAVGRVVDYVESADLASLRHGGATAHIRILVNDLILFFFFGLFLLEYSRAPL